MHVKPAELLTEREAAEFLRIGVNTLRNWRWRREGPKFLKIGERLVRYRLSDLAEFAGLVP